MREVNISEVFSTWDTTKTETPPKLLNIRGCNGAGKSTIPMAMMSDPEAFLLTWEYSGKTKAFATVFPSYNCLAMGTYFNKTGGLDTYKDNLTTRTALELLWSCPYNLIMEGVIASTIKSTYAELFHEFDNREDLRKRDIMITSLLPPIQVCLDRVQLRNGGKEVNTEQITGKWNTVDKNVQYFKDAGFTSLNLDNSVISKEDTLSWYFNIVGLPMPMLSENTSTIIRTPILSGTLLPIESDCEWSSWYKEPNDNLAINSQNVGEYWYFIHERLEIWHKRVILGLPAPWTKDEILTHYKFTNAIRDLDRLSIYYINNILSKLTDTELSKKETIINTMIYRLFCRLETWETFGYLSLTNWDEDWERAKAQLRRRKEMGEPVFTDAYYVYGLHTINPDKTMHNKTENAILLIEYWKERLDDIYDKAFVNAKGMKEQIEYFATLECVGNFTAYEWACDFALCNRYTNVQLVTWTDDSFTNVGPGALRGMNYIFEDKGGMSDLQCIIYLRSICETELSKLGYWDDLKLPDGFTHLNLRVIEHCLCEYSKYKKALEGTGRPKVKFKPKTQNMNDLNVVEVIR